jgi:hypothetical protein
MIGKALFRTAGMAAIAIGAAALPAPAAAQLFLKTPDFRAGPIEGSDPLVGVPMPGATPTEYRAHLLWNIRAGLNVSALQCQFSPFLRTVPNYNGLLAHHSGELATAYTTLNAYFKRMDKVRGQKMFDDYSTITYNNWSTFQGQLGFCQTAASILREALLTPKGGLTQLGERRLRELRNSLLPNGEAALQYHPFAIRLPTLPPLEATCYNKKDQLVRRCGGTAKG